MRCREGLYGVGKKHGVECIEEGPWTCSPLCDDDPPIHFRWPEYVTTERGEEWWIPTLPDDGGDWAKTHRSCGTGNKTTFKLPDM